jgi:hypothetical protein
MMAKTPKKPRVEVLRRKTTTPSERRPPPKAPKVPKSQNPGDPYPPPPEGPPYKIAPKSTREQVLRRAARQDAPIAKRPPPARQIEPGQTEKGGPPFITGYQEPEPGFTGRGRGYWGNERPGEPIVETTYHEPVHNDDEVRPVRVRSMNRRRRPVV